MAAINTLPDIERRMRNFIEQKHLTHSRISTLLQRMYPGVKGLSTMSVRRFCFNNSIHKTSKIGDDQLDQIIASGIQEVGSMYGRKMMKGHLASKGLNVGESRIGESIRRVDPGNHFNRSTLTHFQTNPLPYSALYFGHKLHIDQNEKLVMFGVTHVVAVDGYSGKVVGAILMPVKNCVTIYENLYLKLIQEFGMWDQLRIDMGREWSLMVFIQELLSAHRNNVSITSYVSSTSKNNHTVERLWVEVNSRVNYPLKRILIEMVEAGELLLTDTVHKFCISWFTMNVANAGMKHFVAAWNKHPLPGRRDGRLPRGIPDQRMLQKNEVKRLDSSLIVSPSDAIEMYTSNGRRITLESQFGCDPLLNDSAKFEIRSRSFKEMCPSFSFVFSQVVTGHNDIFKEKLLLFIDITRRLAQT